VDEKYPTQTNQLWMKSSKEMKCVDENVPLMDEEKNKRNKPTLTSTSLYVTSTYFYVM
jgi:hypothetical protein